MEGSLVTLGWGLLDRVPGAVGGFAFVYPAMAVAWQFWFWRARGPLGTVWREGVVRRRVLAVLAGLGSVAGSIACTQGFLLLGVLVFVASVLCLLPLTYRRRHPGGGADGAEGPRP